MDYVYLAFDITPWTVAAFAVGLMLGGAVGRLRRNAVTPLAIVSAILAILSTAPSYGTTSILAWSVALALAGASLGNYISYTLTKFEDKANDLMMQIETTRQTLLQLSATLMKREDEK